MKQYWKAFVAALIALLGGPVLMTAISPRTEFLF